MPKDKERRGSGRGEQTEELASNDLWVRGRRMFGDLEYNESVNTNGLEGARYTVEKKKNQFGKPEYKLAAVTYKAMIMDVEGGEEIYVGG